MKEKVKKHLEDSLVHIDEIGNFCFERKEFDACGALSCVSSNFEATATLFNFLLKSYNTLGITTQDKAIEINPYKQTGFIVVDQSRFTFVATMSILEFTAKEISLRDGLPVKKILDERKNNKKYYHLSDIVNASRELKLVTDNEKKEWDFFIEIRNTLVHNNAIVDKDGKWQGNLEFTVYGKLYSFKKGKEMSGDIQSLFIFSKRVVELFYDWSQKHKKLSYASIKSQMAKE